MLPRGAKVELDIQKMPALPLQIREMEEANMQQHAKDAWTTAWMLKTVLELWERFRIFHELKLSVDNASQERIARMFPELQKFQMVLDACAVLGSEAVVRHGDTPRSPFFARDWIDLYHAIEKLITEVDPKNWTVE